MTRTRAQSIAMIEALREHLGAVVLEIGALRHIGTADDTLLRRPLPAGADPAGLLAWAGWQQIHEHAQIFVRPDPQRPHPWLLVDDVPTADALAFAARRSALAIETSPGNCQLRVLADKPLDAEERTSAQRVLCQHLHGDPASVSGDKWGRLPGYRNLKPGRGRCWTNLLRHNLAGRPVCAEVLLAQAEPGGGGGSGSAPSLTSAAVRRGGCAPGPGSPIARSAGGARPTYGPADKSGGSEIDYAWACAQIRAGANIDAMISVLSAAALKRGKRPDEAGAREYAERTVRAAMDRVLIR